MGGKSKSKSSQDTTHEDYRVGASDQAIAVGANSEIMIQTADPGVMQFGSEILDFAGSLVDLADSSGNRAASAASQAIGFAEGQVQPAEGRIAGLMTTVSIAAIAAFALTKVMK